MRVLLDGCWGFYGARRLDPQSLRDGVERALENARAVKPIQFAADRARASARA